MQQYSKLRDFGTSYVLTLPLEIQLVIRQRLLNLGISVEEVENGMSSRVSDLEDTINLHSNFERELVQVRKLLFKKGATVVVVEDINDPYTPIKQGTKGIVRSVDDVGTVHVAWETGNFLGAALEDNIRLVEGQY